MPDENLSIWTIYDHPVEIPVPFVAIRFEVMGTGPSATEDILCAENLGVLREMMIEMGLFCMPRSPGDDERVIESWL